MSQKIVLLFLGNVICNAAGNLLMKIGMKKTAGVHLAGVNGMLRGLLLNPALIAGVFSYMASLGFYIFILKKVNLSLAYPVSVSSAIIVVTVMSGLMLKENISLTHIIGMVIIFAGIFVITR
jgi:multidrug transporter EmrE-like cation transporter